MRVKANVKTQFSDLGVVVSIRYDRALDTDSLRRGTTLMLEEDADGTTSRSEVELPEQAPHSVESGPLGRAAYYELFTLAGRDSWIVCAGTGVSLVSTARRRVEFYSILNQTGISSSLDEVRVDLRSPSIAVVSSAKTLVCINAQHSEGSSLACVRHSRRIIRGAKLGPELSTVVFEELVDRDGVEDWHVQSLALP